MTDFDREAAAAGKRVDAYLNTVGRLEPEITPVDLPAAGASIAISLRRIADSLEQLQDAIWSATRK